MESEITIPLGQPIELKNKAGDVLDRIESVTLKRPRGLQMRAMDKAEGEMGKMLALIAACANLPRPTVDLMDGDDVLRCSEVLGDFLPSGPAIGARALRKSLTPSAATPET